MTARPTLWIDIEDLLAHVEIHGRPSGIQRVAYEICRALVAADGDRGQVRLLRHAQDFGWRSVDWAQLRQLYGAMSHRVIPAGKPTFLSLQYHALQACGALAKEIAKAIATHFLNRDAEANSFEKAVRTGDTILAIGSPWYDDYPERIASARARYAIRFAMLAYDIVPMRHPEWCGQELRTKFVAWMHAMLPLSDIILSISRATANDVTAYAQEAGISLRAQPRTIPMGSDFEVSPGLVRPGLPARDSYVLMVGTIEPRKNHALAVRIWKALLAERPAADVPMLVFAGRVGWMIRDLMAELAACNWLDGKILHIADPTDAELACLYQGCKFTIFPSFFEGWGLPVTESLGFGKPCLIARTSSLPEAGGVFARSFDPDDLADAVRAVRAVLDNPADLAAWQARVQTEFRPTPWSATAAAVLDATLPTMPGSDP